MQTPFKKIIVYDLETGGLNWKFNPITEFAGLSINTETLEIEKELSVMFKPHLDLTYREEEPSKEAKTIFKFLATINKDSGIKSLQYKGEILTLKNLDLITNDLEKFYSYLELRKSNLINYSEYLELENSDYSDIIELYFDKTYSPQALEVTHISKELLISEGLDYEEGVKKIAEFFKKNTIKNSKPVIAGHNIIKFDNSFMEKLFSDNKLDFKEVINKFVIDTLDLVHLRWFNLSNFTLGNCISELGLTMGKAHRAMADTTGNARLLIKLLQNMRGEGTQESHYTRKKFKMNF